MKKVRAKILVAGFWVLNYILGNPGVGKTALLQMYVNNVFAKDYNMVKYYF